MPAMNNKRHSGGHYEILGTNFKFKTNFSGDPDRGGSFRNTTRKGNIIILDPDMAADLESVGADVKEDTYGNDPVLYTAVIAKFGGPYPPVINVVHDNGDVEQLVDENMLGMLDNIQSRIRYVDVRFNASTNGVNAYCYITHMDVYTNDSDEPNVGNYDPFASRRENYIREAKARLGLE